MSSIWSKLTSYVRRQDQMGKNQKNNRQQKQPCRLQWLEWSDSDCKTTKMIILENIKMEFGREPEYVKIDIAILSKSQIETLDLKKYNNRK